MATAVLQYRVNGGVVTTGVTTVVADDSIQLIAASYAGWGSPASLWKITAYPPGFPCPSGWSTDATTGHYYYLANNVSLIPPPIVMPDSTAIAAGQWGKFLFALIVLGGGTGLEDTSCGVQIASSAGAEDVAVGEEEQFDAKRRYVKALQTNARVLDQAAAGILGGGVLLGTGSPTDVNAATGGGGLLLTAAPFDHGHTVLVGTPVNIGTSNGDGSSDNLARADHVHALPWATVVSVFASASTALGMNGQRITGLAAPSATSDAATKGYADGVVTFARVAAALAAASTAISFNTQKLTGVDTPASNTDAANKAYVDGVLGNAVPLARIINTTLPLTGGGDLSGDITIAINAAAAATANYVVQRGAAGQAAFGWIGAALTDVATAGFIRTSSASTTLIMADSAATPGSNVNVLSIDGTDGIIIGSDIASWVQMQATDGLRFLNGAGDDVFLVDVGSDILQVSNIGGVDIGINNAFTSSAKSYALSTLTAATGVDPADVTWSGQAAFTGNARTGGGFTFTVGAGGDSSHTGGSFTIDFSTLTSGNVSGVLKLKGGGSTMLTVGRIGSALEFTPAIQAKWVLPAAGFAFYDNSSNLLALVDPAGTLSLDNLPTLKFGAGKPGVPLSPTITQAKMAGTSGTDAPIFTIEGAQGEDATGVADNSAGGDIRIRGGAPGTGGSGGAGARGNIILGAGSASAGTGQNVVVVNDAVAYPSSPGSGFVLYGNSGALRVLQHAPPALSGSRANPEQALKNLITLGATMGLWTDSTTA